MINNKYLYINNKLDYYLFIIKIIITNYCYEWMNELTCN
jgi:hypothetical protein